MVSRGLSLTKTCFPRSKEIFRKRSAQRHQRRNYNQWEHDRYGEINLPADPDSKTKTNTKEITLTTDLSSDPAAQLDKTVKRLVANANENGGDDNITAVMVEIL